MELVCPISKIKMLDLNFHPYLHCKISMDQHKMVFRSSTVMGQLFTCGARTAST